MSKCLVCSIEITDANDSDEHIIPNSIGGKLVINDFLCGKCNSETGDRWDAQLSKDLNWMCLFLGGVNRHRRSTPSQEFSTKSGRKIKLSNGGVMNVASKYFPKQAVNGRGVYKFKGDYDCGVKFVEKILKKYPYVNNEDVEMVSHEVSLNEDPLVYKPAFGDKDHWKSVIKTMLSFAKYVGIDPFLCEKAADYIVNEGDIFYSFYYGSDLIKNRNFEKPAHCIAIHADPVSGYIIGYLEYFGVYCMISILSDCYGGKEIKKSYYIYPEDSKYGSFYFNLPLNKEVIELYCKYNEKVCLDRFEFFLNYCYVKSVVRDAYKKALKKTGLKPGDDFSQEKCLEFSREFSIYFMDLFHK